MPPMMFEMIDAATLLYEPFSKCAAFHVSIPRLSDLTRKCLYVL